MISTKESSILIGRLFPFYFSLDQDLIIKDAGLSLKKIIGDDCIESKFSDFFTFLRPGLGIKYHIDSIKQYENQIFILQGKSQSYGFRLKGEFIFHQENRTLLFCGSPWIVSEKDFENLGLKIKDFALHDSTIDMIQNLRVQRMAVEDSNYVNKMLATKNEELKKTNSELDRFVYSVSHDLRSPLLSINGIIDIIKQKETLSDSGNQLLQMIINSIDRLDNSIVEILDYSRNARFDVEHVELDLNDILQEITTDLQHLAPVTFNIQFETPAVIISDKFRLITILKNTISNAVKYRKNNQPDCFVNIKVSKEDNYTIIHIEDNGIGISEKSLPKIFDMFYRATSSVAGTGLGLYICKEMITKLGGTITLDSKLGEGTSIAIRIPTN
jgi:signal transduction histidine kinase